MKIPCSVVRDLLPLYAEDMIEEETRALVDEHLEECSECSQRLEEIKATAAVPAENTTVDTAKPLLALKKMINKRRWMTAAIAALCVFILLVSAFHRINDMHQVPWEEGLIQVIGVEKMADVEKRNSPFPEEEEAIQQPDESRVLTLQFDSKITGINSAREIMEDGTVTEIIQGWSNNPNKKLTGDYSEITFCPVPDRVMYDTGNGQVLLWGEPADGGVVIMPRLALASYAILACCLASLSALLWFLFRNRQCAPIFRQVFFAPVSYLAGHLLIKGFHARTFFLEDDLGCILLVGAAVYALLTLGWTAWQQQKRDKGTEPLQN